MSTSNRKAATSNRSTIVYSCKHTSGKGPPKEVASECIQCKRSKSALHEEASVNNLETDDTTTGVENAVRPSVSKGIVLRESDLASQVLPSTTEMWELLSDERKKTLARIGIEAPVQTLRSEMSQETVESQVAIKKQPESMVGQEALPGIDVQDVGGQRGQDGDHDAIVRE